MEDRKNPMIYIGIDPSIEHTGWAVVKRGDNAADEFILLSSGVTKLPANLKYGRVGQVGYILKSALELFVSDSLALIELPTFEKSARGVELMKQRGIIKLAMAAGACVSAMSMLGIPYATITANQWKRGISKTRMKQRVDELFPEKAGNWLREDEWEAVAIACWGHVKAGTYEVYS